MKTCYNIKSVAALAVVALFTGVTAAFADSGDDGFPDHTNPPSVTIVAPEEGGFVLSGHPVVIHALTLNFTDTVTSVEFLAGTNSLGTVSNSTSVWGGDDEESSGHAVFTLIWSNAAVGAYSLTAQATDAAGLSVTSAPVTINVVTDLPPVITLVKPHDNAVILGSSNITLLASAYDPDGTVANVKFFADDIFLGTVTNPPVTWVTNSHGVFPICHTAYSFSWSNTVPGKFTLSAVATDNAGVMSTSSPVSVSIVTNLPPLVRILQPDDDHACFLSPANIGLVATASSPSGVITNVEFFEDGTGLGTVTNITTVTNWEGKVLTLYSQTWDYVLAGTYTLTAVATDGIGDSSTSAPVVVTVKSPPPPSVRFISPENRGRFHAPAQIELVVKPEHFVNPIASVQFLSGTNTLAVVTGHSYVADYHWRDVPAGSYSLTAIAKDLGGASATSAVVNITVNPNPSHGENGHDH